MTEVEQKRAVVMALGAPSSATFHCLGCYQSVTLGFDPDEMLEMDYEVHGYSGPCPKCKREFTLLCRTVLFGDANV